MNRLGKIAPIIVIVASLASGFFGFELQTMKKKHLDSIADLTEKYNTTTAELGSTKKNLKTAQADLTQTKGDLAKASTDLSATKVALDQKTQESDGLKTEMASKDQELQKSKTDLAAAQDTLTKIREGLKSVGIEDISSVDKLRDKIVNLGDENKILAQQLTSLHTENQQMKERLEYLTTTPVGLRGHVTVVQEKWGFLVLDVGQSQRVQPNAEFLVYRDTKLVGKVQVVSVAANNCIAQILPEYSRSTPAVGDLIIH